MTFYLTAADLRAWFRLIEPSHPIRYAHTGAFIHSEPPVYDRIDNVPDLDLSPAWYALFWPGESLRYREYNRFGGGTWIGIDCDDNRRPRLWTGGVAEDLLAPGCIEVGEPTPQQATTLVELRHHAACLLHPLHEVFIGPDALPQLLTGSLRIPEHRRGYEPPKFHPCVLGRDLLRPERVDVAWRTAAVLRLARSVADGDWAALPVLGDALEDAGCTDAVFLGHCRWTGEHRPECWVAPLLLGDQP